MAVEEWAVWEAVLELEVVPEDETDGRTMDRIVRQPEVCHRSTRV